MIRHLYQKNLIKINLIIPNPQLKAGTALFTGLCSPDGCSEAPMDGFMASDEKSRPGLGQKMLSFSNQKNK